MSTVMYIGIALVIPEYYVTNNYDNCQYRYSCDDLKRPYHKNILAHAYVLGHGVLEMVADVAEAVVPVGV